MMMIADKDKNMIFINDVESLHHLQSSCLPIGWHFGLLSLAAEAASSLS